MDSQVARYLVDNWDLISVVWMNELDDEYILPDKIPSWSCIDCCYFLAHIYNPHLDRDDFSNDATKPVEFEPGFMYQFEIQSHLFTVIPTTQTECYYIDYYEETQRSFPFRCDHMLIENIKILLDSYNPALDLPNKKEYLHQFNKVKNQTADEFWDNIVNDDPTSASFNVYRKVKIKSISIPTIMSRLYTRCKKNIDNRVYQQCLRWFKSS